MSAPSSALLRRPSFRQRVGLYAALARRPGEAAVRVLEDGTLGVALIGILLACLVAALNTARFASSVAVSDIVYGPQRSPIVTNLVEELGAARFAVVVYLVEQAWAAVLVATAVAPLFVWLLGATAVHAAARLASAGRPFRPLLVYAGYATAVALVPANGASVLLEGDPSSPLAALGRLVGFALLLWLGYLLYRGIEAYYRVSGTRAITILFVAVTLFYVVPLFIIATAVVAIVSAAVFLELA